MVIKDSGPELYVEPLKKLFPKGEYWDRLLSDENGDVSLVCAARSETLARFRERMNQLQRESFPGSADETIGDWERVCFGYENDGAELEQRRSLLRIRMSGCISILKDIAEAFGGTVRKWEVPYTPAAFGHAQFGLTYMSSIAGLWIVFVHCSVPEERRSAFETAVRDAMLANQTVFFVYGD